MNNNSFGEDGINFSVGNFSLAIGLRMIWRRFSMVDHVLLHEFCDKIRCELGSLICDYFSRYSKLGEYSFIEKICYLMIPIVCHSLRFNPFSCIINTYQDVWFSMRRRFYWADEVNSPLFKRCDYHLWLRGISLVLVGLPICWHQS